MPFLRPSPPSTIPPPAALFNLCTTASKRPMFQSFGNVIITSIPSSSRVGAFPGHLHTNQSYDPFVLPSHRGLVAHQRRRGPKSSGEYVGCPATASTASVLYRAATYNHQRFSRGYLRRGLSAIKTPSPDCRAVRQSQTPSTGFPLQPQTAAIYTHRINPSSDANLCSRATSTPPVDASVPSTVTPVRVPRLSPLTTLAAAASNQEGATGVDRMNADERTFLAARRRA